MARTQRWRPVVAVSVCALAGLRLRIGAALSMGSHLDEGASVLALERLAGGSVHLPSGVPYLQGFTLSVVALPLRWVGSGTIDDLTALRLVSCIAGTVAVLLTGWLAWRLSQRTWCAALAAAMLAVDPTSVQWSGFFRMYALLQALTVAIVLVASVVVVDGPTRGRMALLVGLGWAAVLTQVQAAIVLLPVIVALLGCAAWSRWRTSWRSLLVGAAGLAAAPVVLVVANRILGGGASGADAGAGGATFVGGNWIVLESMRSRSWATWWSVVGSGPAGRGAAVLVVVGSAVVVASALRRSDLALALLPVVHWFGVAVVSALIASSVERYVLFVVPLSFAIVAVGVGIAAAALGDRLHAPPPLRAAGAALVLVLAAVSLDPTASTSRWSESPDMVAAAQEVARRRADGQQTLVTLPPGPGLVLGFERVAFLAGRPDGERYRLYTRVNAAGERTDFWLGAPVVASAADLCEALLVPEGAWVIAPDKYLADPTWFTPEQREVIERLTVDAGGIDYYTRLRRTGAMSNADRRRCRQLGWDG